MHACMLKAFASKKHHLFAMPTRDQSYLVIRYLQLVSFLMCRLIPSPLPPPACTPARHPTCMFLIHNGFFSFTGAVLPGPQKIFRPRVFVFSGPKHFSTARFCFPGPKLGPQNCFDRAFWAQFIRPRVFAFPGPKIFDRAFLDPGGKGRGLLE